MIEQAVEEKIREYGVAKLARELGLTKQAVYAWFERGRLPAEHLIKIEELTGINRVELWPELYL